VDAPKLAGADSSVSCTRNVVRKEGGAVIRDGPNSLSSTWVRISGKGVRNQMIDADSDTVW
jgi:hypothetical protein